MPPMNTYFAECALLPSGWARNLLFEINSNGAIESATADAEPGDAQRLSGPVIPGMPNLHSHAFQRAMAGLAERAGPSDDSFWTWRQVMYGFVGRLSPDHVEAIAAQLYVEMLKSGYTAVGEFHYLHHGPDGSPYDDACEMSHRVIAAAKAAGIGITHLPVLYAHGGFGDAAASPGQRRFLHGAEDFMALVDDLIARYHHDPEVRIGIAPHSLRAVSPELLSQTVAALDARDGAAPIHIHIAEQQLEVDDCIAWSGARPVQWLLDPAAVSRRWCLIHATHMTGEETLALARSGAVAGLCPTTEANLGDGLFPLFAYLAAGGALGVGSDSHISVSPTEELRWLEYGQRLAGERRNITPVGEGGSIGAGRWRTALAEKTCWLPLTSSEVVDTSLCY